MKKKLLPTLVTLTFFMCSYSQQNSVDIPNASSFYVQQQMDSWCWAACNQILLRASGIDESQEHQCIKVFGTVVNKGAGGDYELAKVGLKGNYQNKNGNFVTVTPYVSYLAQKNSNDPLVIIDKLKNGIPLVMATFQHGFVCVGVDYVTNGSYYQITKLRLLDPYYGSSYPVEYTMQQFLQMGLIGFMTYNIQ